MQQRRQALLAELGRAFWRLPALRLAALGESPGRSLPAALARGLHLVAGSLTHLELEAPQLATLDWVASARVSRARVYCAVNPPYATRRCSPPSTGSPVCARCHCALLSRTASPCCLEQRVQLQALLPRLQCCASTAARQVLAGLIIMVRLGHMLAGVPLLTCLSLRGCFALAAGELWALCSCPCLAALDLRGLRQLVGPAIAVHVHGANSCAETPWKVGTPTWLYYKRPMAADRPWPYRHK